MSNFRELAREAGVSAPFLALHTGRSLSGVHRWYAGSANAPDLVVAWLHRRISDPPPVLPDYVPVPPKR